MIHRINSFMNIRHLINLVESTNQMIHLTVDGHTDTLPLSQFFADNADGISVEEQHAIRQALNTEGYYVGGGGAYPEWKVSVEVDEGEVVSLDQSKRKAKQIDKPDLHPQADELLNARGLHASDPDMKRNIGRVFKWKNYPQPWMGTMHKLKHKIVGVQKDYAGNLVYRAVPVKYPDSFGCCVRPSEIEFLDSEVKNFPR